MVKRRTKYKWRHRHLHLRTLDEHQLIEKQFFFGVSDNKPKAFQGILSFIRSRGMDVPSGHDVL